MTAVVYDPRRCELGEGAFWHPQREQLFWFDILGRRLLSRDGARPLEWRFDVQVSAAGWIDRETLLVAAETGLFRFGIDSGALAPLLPLEAERPETRSNDGRADPMGGFWIGTMGKRAEPGMGAIYRYAGGEIRRLFDRITIPNAICFAADGRTAHFADTAAAQVFRVPLDPGGWPSGQPELFLDLAAEGLAPDGAVIDAEGAFWNAQWGAGRVARYLPDGSFDRAIAIGGRHASCPAFGGPDLATLHVTTAREGLGTPGPGDGVVYACAAGVPGRPEPRLVVGDMAG